MTYSSNSAQNNTCVSRLLLSTNLVANGIRSSPAASCDHFIALARAKPHCPGVMALDSDGGGSMRHESDALLPQKPRQRTGSGVSSGSQGGGSAGDPLVSSPAFDVGRLPHRWRTRHGVFFKGKDLVHEVSFSCFYHHDTRNQVLHLASLAFVLFGLFLFLLLIPLPAPLPAPVSFPLLPAAFAMAYVIYYATLDPATAGAWGVAFAALVAASFQLRVSSVGVACGGEGRGGVFDSCSVYVTVAGLCVSTVVLQLVGHIVWERRLPAFRGFEAAVLTPFFLGLNVLFWLGFQRDVRAAVYGLAPMWAGTERRTF